jgi:hypothetical protein
MSNSPSVPKPPEAKVPTAKASENFFIQLLERYPWLLLVGVSVFFISSAAVALYSLAHVGGVEPQEPKDTVSVENWQVESPPATPYLQTSEPSSHHLIPFWMLGAIAASCASGCFLIFRFLNSTTAKQTQKTKRLPSYYPQRPESKNLPAPAARSLRRTSPTANPQTPTIAVLPPQENSSSSPQSLATMLDIRKQTSLSTLLRK